MSLVGAACNGGASPADSVRHSVHAVSLALEATSFERIADEVTDRKEA